MSDFPNRLKKLRSDSKLTQKQLAEKLSVSQNAVYNWENGKREPNLDMMKKIAKVFDIALYILLDDTYPLPDITSEAWKNRARVVGDTEMETRPKPFTTRFSEPDEFGMRNGINMLNMDRETTQKILHDYNHDHPKKDNETVAQEKKFKKIEIEFGKLYGLLNNKGRKKADKQIARALEAIEVLTKVPEYQKKPDE